MYSSEESQKQKKKHTLFDNHNGVKGGLMFVDVSSEVTNTTHVTPCKSSRCKLENMKKTETRIMTT